jgi:hypothetical protein
MQFFQEKISKNLIFILNLLKKIEKTLPTTMIAFALVLNDLLDLDEENSYNFFNRNYGLKQFFLKILINY